MKTSKKQSIKAEKSIGDWVVAIYCDYGNSETKTMIRASYSSESGQRSWIKFYKMFSKNGFRCWQEDKQGNLINDSNLEKSTSTTQPLKGLVASALRLAGDT